MLPNHAPLVIAEQFGTLAALFPGRIDLGVGRAPGTDPRTALALRRTLARRPRSFPAGCAGIDRLSGRSPAANRCEPSRARARSAGLDAGLEPLWREVGGGAGPALCVCLAFRAGTTDRRALRFTEEPFHASRFLAKPYVMLGIKWWRPTAMRKHARLLPRCSRLSSICAPAGPGTLPPPVDDIAPYLADPRVAAMLRSVLAVAQVGSPRTVKAGLEAFVSRYQPDELMVAAQIYRSRRAQALLRAFLGPLITRGGRPLKRGQAK